MVAPMARVTITAMMAITTMSSMSVKPCRRFPMSASLVLIHAQHIAREVGKIVNAESVRVGGDVAAVSGRGGPWASRTKVHILARRNDLERIVSVELAVVLHVRDHPKGRAMGAVAAGASPRAEKCVGLALADGGNRIPV